MPAVRPGRRRRALRNVPGPGSPGHAHPRPRPRRPAPCRTVTRCLVPSTSPVGRAGVPQRLGRPLTGRGSAAIMRAPRPRGGRTADPGRLAAGARPGGPRSRRAPALSPHAGADVPWSTPHGRRGRWPSPRPSVRRGQLTGARGALGITPIRWPAARRRGTRYARRDARPFPGASRRGGCPHPTAVTPVRPPRPGASTCATPTVTSGSTPRR
ncbi:hypothetical protein SCATT_p11610 (plasmid) [Streptantibioticus cattleyicolor NRRL 8057 = DSM 46488]|uniref:Uncharacterized protein n=1 Tax=Streptantibioticus cattleyicolor (strain ATCC 35852 / DSM 46488 / JCM 4925 / NBRC 14057 / NRRL 8057) TaxID=1003195 RepID=G8XET1_STREN|nr:hypothetical protein SCATT_p11610 [Streptantibioticus cattleyicolor NRRL 8057 = DSM 46488]